MKRKQGNVLNGRGSSGTSGAEEDRLFREGVQHQQAGRLAEAKSCFRQVLTINPAHADAMHLLGLIALEEKESELAIELMSQSVDLNRSNPFYFSNLGVALKNQDRLDEAITAYREAIALKPDYAEAHSNLGTALKLQGQLDAAVVALREAARFNPGLARAHFRLGAVLNDIKDSDGALQSFNKAIGLRPDYFEALVGRGNLLQGLKRSDEALADYDMALTIQPGQAGLHHNRGTALHVLQRYEGALASFRTALKLDPNYAEAHLSQGAALLALNRFDEALLCLDRVISLQPDHSGAWLDRGAALQGLDRLDEALASYDRALSIKPDLAAAWNNRGNALKSMRRFDDALASYEKAQVLDTDYADAHWNEALVRLLTGDFERGWTKSEWRLQATSLGLRKRQFEKPTWLGEQPVEGKTILVHADQGFGDTIQFCRYVPMLAALGARVIVEVEEPLRQLLTTLDGVSACVSKGGAVPHFDLQCPMLSLPLAFRTRLESIPCSAPYLRPSPEKAKLSKDRLGPRNRPRVGLVWSGNPQHANDRNRSIRLEQLLPLLDVAASFVSLQRELRAADEIVLARHPGILNLGASMASFDDTAALISELDLVISVDTSVAHLVGALGVPVWIVLPFDPDWRWLLDRDDSPWYPTARLFRQPGHGDWASVIARVRDSLQLMARDCK